MKVVKLDLGPLLGATKTDSIRISGRVRPSFDHGAPNTFLVLRYRKAGSTGAFETVMNPTPVIGHHDFMAAIDVRGVPQPDTVYEYQIGYVRALKPPVNPQNLDWNWQANAGESPPGINRFKTFHDDAARPVSFVLGSCRHISLKKNDGSWVGGDDDRHGDLTFGRILSRFPPPKGNTHVRGNSGNVDFVLMTGDQIYADTRSKRKYRHAKEFSDYTERYRKAFSTRNAARLLSSYPTYMTWDDHEVINNWPPRPHKECDDDSGFKDCELYKNASRAYEAYQVLQSPVELSDGRYWYDFSAGCADIFVMDVRSERRFEKPKDHPNKKFQRTDMIGNIQMKALKKWLTKPAESKRVKLIVSGVPLFPDGAYPYYIFRFLGGKDTWRSYPAQREEILDYINEKKVKRVAFLSGDLHCSFSAKLSKGKGDPPWIYNVVASAFHWYSFGWNDSSLFNKKYLKGRGGRKTGYFTEKINKSVETKDNYVRVVCSPEKLMVETYRTNNGKCVSSLELPFPRMTDD